MTKLLIFAACVFEFRIRAQGGGGHSDNRKIVIFFLLFVFHGLKFPVAERISADSHNTQRSGAVVEA